MIRAIAPLSLALALLLLSAPSAAADALLRSRVVVEGDKVTLGDIFDNVGDKASQVVLQAPPAGQRVTVDNDWLHHVATKNGISWHSRDLFDEAVIERAGKIVNRDQVQAMLQEALIARGAPADSIIETDKAPPSMVVPLTSQAQLTVRDLFYDKDAKRFTATLAVSDNGKDDAHQQISGRLVPCVMVPVLTRPIARGDQIAAQDITWIKMREQEVRATMVTDIGLIVGMAAKQPLRTGLPLAAADLQKPLAVQRGALVTMTLNQGGMSLSAQGRAIDQGSLGDVIRVTNTHSNLTVEGTIDATNHVRVTLNGAIALAN